MKYIICLLLLAGCAGSLPPPETVVTEVDKIRDAAIEICVLAHSVNAGLNKEPELTEYRGKIDEICDPALSALDLATSAGAQAVLVGLQKSIGGLMYP